MASPKTATATNNSNRKPADAWLNISLPITKADGTKGLKKLGGIPLDNENPLHSKLIEATSHLEEADFKEVFLAYLEKSNISLYVDSGEAADFTIG